MSYYFNDGYGNTYGDKQYTRTTKPIKEVYRYKTLLTNENGTCQSNYPLFYIKDGSVPWFDPHWSTNDGITAYDTQYLPVMVFSISSISGKYYMSDLPAQPDTTMYYPSYYIPFCTTPFLYKADVYLGEKPIISRVDKTKGGKISWRMSESNTVFYNFQHRNSPSNNYVVYQLADHGRKIYYTGNNVTTYDPDAWSSNITDATAWWSEAVAQQLCTLIRSSSQINPSYEAYLQDDSTFYIGSTRYQLNDYNFNSNYQSRNMNNNAFICRYENDTSYLTPGTVNFYKSKPYFDNDNTLIYTSSFGVDTGSTPSHITFRKSDLTNYSKLKIKMDGLFVHANNNFSQYNVLVTALDDSFINNDNSFGAGAKNPYCIGLFYTTNNDEHWYISTPQANYINDGHVFSNLEYDSSVDKLVPKNTSDYTVDSTGYNDSYADEIQDLSNKRVWDNVIPVYVADNYHLWTTARDEYHTCTATGAYITTGDGDPVHSELCPYCNSATSNNVKYDAGTFYVKCNKDYVRADDLYPLLEDIKIPVYENADDVYPVAYSLASELSDSQLYSMGAVCNGNGETNKMTYVVEHSNSFIDDAEYATTTDLKKKWQHRRFTLNGQNRLKTLRDRYNRIIKVPCPCCNQPIQGINGSNYCGEPGYIECYCARTDNPRAIIKTHNTRPEDGIVKCSTCDGTGKFKKYSDRDVCYRFRFYGINSTTTTPFNSFEGFIRKSSLEGIQNSIYYSAAPDLAQNNWRENAAQLFNQAKTLDPNCMGIYYKENSEKSDFTDYRAKIRPGRYLTASYAGVQNISSNWILLTPFGSRTCNRYYNYGNSNYDIDNDYGVSVGFTLDKAWSNYTDKDVHNNYFKLDYEYRPNGMSPTAGTNFTISNVTLNYDIPITQITGDYLHIATPCVTNFHGTGPTNCGNITQMIMTWEAE